MDGHYVSNGKLERMIRKAEGIEKYMTVSEIKEEVNDLCHLLREVNHDASNFINKYDCG